MGNKQYYGIKYPFTNNDVENYFLDVNKDWKSKIRSLLMHIIFTPKGQKIRDPEFGTNLIKYLFEPNEETSWDGIKNEINEAVNKYMTGITINEISALESSDDLHQIYVRLDYTVNNGIQKINDSIITKI